MTTHQEDTDFGTGLLTHTEHKTLEPRLYKVILLNDDFTPMDFVVQLIVTFFNKTVEEATIIMLQVHHKGMGVCGIFTREIAETKVMQVNRYARANGHPLRSKMEET